MQWCHNFWYLSQETQSKEVALKVARDEVSSLMQELEKVVTDSGAKKIDEMSASVNAIVRVLCPETARNTLEKKHAEALNSSRGHSKKAIPSSYALYTQRQKN